MNSGVTVNIAIVVQRYGDKIVGGAETHARLLAEYLVSQKNWTVSVFSTCAKDYLTWANELPEGVIEENGVRINRFLNQGSRSPLLFSLVNRAFLPVILLLHKFRRLNSLALRLERRWARWQGPFCPDLVTELHKCSDEFDLVVFFTYLYYPTTFGVPGLRAKKILIPTAHDEPPVAFKLTAQIFQQVDGIVVNTEAERELIKKYHPNLDMTKIRIGAFGIDQIESSLRDPRRKPGDLPKDSYFVYVGRIGRSKGVGLLIRCIEKLRHQQPDRDWRLVLAGARDKNFSDAFPDFVVFSGYVEEHYKASLIENAFAVVNASPLESMSILVLEASLAKRPILLNLSCRVFEDYCKDLPGAFGFHDEETFAQAVGIIQKLQETDKCEDALERSRQIVAQRFSWEKVTENLLC